MNLKDFFNTKKRYAIRCDNPIDAMDLFTRFNEMGKKWVDGKPYCPFNTKLINVMESTCYTNDGYAGPIEVIQILGYHIYDFNEIDDFKFKQYRYLLDGTLFVDKVKKTVVFKKNEEVYKVKCDEEDKFDWKIGFGLALSHCYGDQLHWKETREHMRNKKTHKLDYKRYAKWCVIEYFKNNVILIDLIDEQVKKIKTYGKVEL